MGVEEYRKFREAVKNNDLFQLRKIISDQEIIDGAEIVKLQEILETEPETYWQAKKNWNITYAMYAPKRTEEYLQEFRKATKILVSTIQKKYQEAIEIFNTRDSYKEHRWKGRVWDMRKAFKDYREIKNGGFSEISHLLILDGLTEWQELEETAKSTYLQTIEQLMKKGTKNPAYLRVAKKLIGKVLSGDTHKKAFRLVESPYSKARSDALELAQQYDELFQTKLFAFVDDQFSNAIEGTPYQNTLASFYPQATQ